MAKHASHRSNKGVFGALPCADTLGIAASTLCMIHCVALPFLIAFLPGIFGTFVHSDWTHVILAFFVASFCLLGILPGFLRHSERSVLLLMVVGLSLVLFATFASSLILNGRFELPLMTAGNLMVVAAHYRNRKLLHSVHSH